MNVQVIATSPDDAGEIIRRLAPGAIIKTVSEEERPVSVPDLFRFWVLARAATWQKPSERVDLFILKKQGASNV